MISSAIREAAVCFFLVSIWSRRMFCLCDVVLQMSLIALCSVNFDVALMFVAMSEVVRIRSRIAVVWCCSK